MKIQTEEAAMKPAIPKTGLPPSTQLRKVGFGGAHRQYQDTFRRLLVPNKRTLISVSILWMFFMPVGKGIAQLNTGAWPMLGHDIRHTGQSEYTEKAFGVLKWCYQVGGADDVLTSPAIAGDGTVYVGSRANWVYALNPNGTSKWFYYVPWGSGIYSSPAIGSDGVVYVGAYYYVSSAESMGKFTRLWEPS